MSRRPPVSRISVHLLGVLILISMAICGPAAPTGTAEEPRLSTLVLRNGNEIQGEIVPPRLGLHPQITPGGELIFVDEDGIPADRVDTTFVQFRSADGVTTRFRRSMIEQILLPDDSENAATGELWEQRAALVLRGDLIGQLDIMTQIYAMEGGTPEVLRAAFELQRTTFQEARRLTQIGRLDDAFELWDALILHLDETGLEIRSPDPNVIQDLGVERDFQQAYVEALRLRVEDLIGRAESQDPVDLQTLYQAHVYNEHLLNRAPMSLEGRLNRIDIAQLRGDVAGALTQAEELMNNLPAGTSRQAEVAIQLRIDTLRREIDPTLRSGSAFPPAQPQGPSISGGLLGGNIPPAQPSVQQPSVQRAPPPTVSASRSYWTRMRRHLSERNWSAAWTETRDALERAGPKAQVPLLILGALVVFWVIPYKIVKSRANRGSISASLWAPRVKLLGLLGFVFWMLSPMGSVFARREKEQRDLCPHCGGDIGNVGLYRDFNFMACPHCNEAITPICDLQGYISHLIDDINRVRGGKALGVEAMDGKIEREAMLRLVHATLTLAIRKRASDLHVDASDDGLDLRARIDGVLAGLDIHVPRAIERAFVSAIKVMAELDITERRAPQDGRFSVTVDNEEIDIRINTSPTGMGEKISMRFLNPNDVRVPLEKLGITQQAMPAFRSAITSPHGLMLVTGPTGCGKSTTLYVALQEINNGTRNIVTLEDPIEYVFRGLNQHQVNPAANFTFATGLRSILRQDPDVIMVGEIRDRETADIAVDAATTGHLVMTTLHTIDAASAYQRMAELGIDPRRSAPSLLLIIAQRLIRLICTSCKQEYKPDPTALAQLGLETVSKDMIFHQGTGCPTCDNLGHRGRIGLFEMMVINDELRFLMEGNTPVAGLREAARRAGMHTLREEGISRIMEGISTPEEVLRVIS